MKQREQELNDAKEKLRRINHLKENKNPKPKEKNQINR